MVRFDLAGRRKDHEKVFLMSDHRSYQEPTTLFHRNDYHTVVKMTKAVFKTNFKYEASSGIYRNLTDITWEKLREVATIETFKV